MMMMTEKDNINSHANKSHGKSISKTIIFDLPGASTKRLQQEKCRLTKVNQLAF